MTTIVVFFVSLFLIIFLFVLKYIEVKKNRKIWFLELLSKADNFSSKLLFRIIQAKQTIKYIFVVYIPEITKQKKQKYKEGLILKIASNKEKIMGRRNIENKGSASFFLRKIDQNKKDIGKGVINDVL